MKALLFLIAAGLAVASRGRHNYEAGTEYVYRYESQAITGVPHHGIQYAGLKINAIAKLQFKSPSLAALKLEDVTICQIQTAVSAPWPESGLLPESMCNQVERTVQEEMTDELTKPIQFTYENGKVRGVQMDQEEPTWSVNLKKGILSSLKVNLNAEDISEEEIINEMNMMNGGLIEDNDDWVLNEQWKYNDDWKVNDDFGKWKFGFPLPVEHESFFTRVDTNDVQTVMEADVSGVCKTIYGVMPLVDSDNRLKVMKVKDYDNCILMPKHEQGLISGLTLFPMEYDGKDLIKKSSETEYELRGTANVFVIEKVRQDSKYIVTPMKQEHGSAVTSTKQHLDLIEVKPIERTITPSGGMTVKTKGLLYEFSDSSSEKPMIFQMNRMNMEFDSDTDDEEKIRMVDTLLEETIPLIHPIVTESSIEKIKKIACIMKTLSEHSMIRLCEKYLRPESMEFSNSISRKGEILLDILPTLTTPKVLPVAAHLITNRLISETRAVITIKMIALTITPDVQTLKLLKPTNGAFAAHPVVRQNRVLRSTIHMNFGSIVRRFILSLQNKGKSMGEIRSLLETHFIGVEEGYRMIKATRDPYDKAAIVKGMANMADEPALPLIAEMAKDKSESHMVRRVAISSLQKMPHVPKGKTEKILLSIYMDLTESPEIRIPAFITLIDLKPCEGMLQAVAKIQRKETSVQVGSLVYSYLSSLASAKLPGLRELACRIRKVMPLVRAIMPNTYRNAKGLHLDYFCEYSDMGVGLDLLKINGMREVIPSAFVAKVSLNALGKTIEAFQAGVHINGAQQILSKLFGAQRRFTGNLQEKPIKEVLQILLRPLQSGNVDLGSVATEIKNIIAGLGIVDRPVLENLNLGVYLKFFGNDVSIIDITADDILSWIETGEMPIIGEVSEVVRELTRGSKTLDIMKVIDLGTSSVQLPTPMGLPMFVNMTALAITHIVGEASVSASGIMDMINYGITGNLPSEVTLAAQIKTSMAAEIATHMGVTAGLLSTGITLKTKAQTLLPAKIDVSLNTNTGKLTTAVKLPTEQIEALKAEVVPETFVLAKEPRRCCLNSAYTTERITHPAHRQSVEIRFPVPVSLLNNRVNVKVVVPKSLRMYMPFDYIWGHKSVSIVLEPIRRSVPIEIELELRTKGIYNDVNVDLNSILSEGINVNPLISEPKVIKASLSIGTKNDRKLYAAIHLITSRDLALQQISTRITVPSYWSGHVSADAFLNLNAMSTHMSRLASLSPNTPVAEIEVQTGSGTSMKLKLMPHNGAPVTWDKWVKNIYFRMIEKVIQRPVTVMDVDSVPSMETVTYKVQVEGTNVNWHKVETIGLSLLTASYAYLGVPSVPSMDAKDVQGSSEGIQGLLTVIPELNKAVITVRTPMSMQYSMEIPTYISKPWYKMTTLETPILEGYSDIPDSMYISPKYPMERIMPGTCIVYRPEGSEEEIVNTFDSKTFNFPSLPRSCEVLLAKDCSPFSMFTVLLKPTEEKKILKIFTPRNQIEIEPERSWLSARTHVKVKLNGDEMTMSEDDLVPIRENSLTGTPVFGEISKQGSWVTVRASSIGLVVRTDGRKVVVQTGRLMGSNVCGLCGNFNDEPEDDFEGPDMQIYSDSNVMISKYVVSNSRCSSSDVREQYGIQELREGSCLTEERTHVREAYGKTCFSVDPVPVCPSSCRTTERVTRTLPFVCRNSNYASTQRLVEESRIRILDEMASRKFTDNLSVEVPSECTPRN